MSSLLSHPAPLLFLSLLACRAPAAGAAPRAAQGTPAAPAAEGGIAQDPGVPDPAADPTSGDERAAQAVALIRAGDYGAARGKLDGLLIDQHIDEARRLLQAGKPEDALNAIDQVLDLQPDEADACFLKGEASLMLAEKTMKKGGSAILIEGALGDALAYYQKVADRPEALFGASRAAYLLKDQEKALELAEKAMAAGGERADASELRTFAEVVQASYAAAKDDPAKADEAKRLGDEAEDALGRLTAKNADDPWAWGQLSDLYELEERLPDARATLEKALARLPQDGGLVERLARVARKQGGSVEAMNALAGFNESHGPSALGRWYEGKERFEHALVGLGTGEYMIDQFQKAEQLFAGCRDLVPGYDKDCKGYEVMCRAGVGWCHYHTGDLEQAKKDFLAMNDLLEHGVEWRIEGRLGSGIDGLQFIGGAYNDKEQWISAAQVFDTLRGLQPEESKWANNAGFFYREAAVQEETLGKRFCKASTAGDASPKLLEQASVPDEAAGTPRAAQLLARAADKAMKDARARMAKSRDAYFEAARLAPDDVRIQNDAALVLVYYLHTDLDKAEEMLKRCVSLGEEQLKDDSLTDDQRWQLKNAWGDAHENLGVLYANHRGDMEEAARWFQKALDIGPDPRPVITDFWLPYVHGERPADDTVQQRDWAEPCGKGAR